MKDYKIKNNELQVMITLCFILGVRVLGMFLIFPILSTYGIYLEHSNQFLIGCTIGVYGLAQACFQIPLGVLSDKIGRKPVIFLGLILFLLGSLISISTGSIWSLIAGRILQGCGAISSTCMALLSDVISDKNRIQSMLLIGFTYGIAFSLSIVVSPIIVYLFGFHILLTIVIYLSIISIIIAYFGILNCNISTNSYNFYKFKNNFFMIVKDLDLWKFNISIFFLHILLTLNLIVFPVQLNTFHYSIEYHWKIYLITIFFSFFIVYLLLFFVRLIKKINIMLFISSIILFLTAIIFLNFLQNVNVFLLGIQLFFIGFNMLEALLPSLISKKSCIRYKGTIMGIYSSSQFLGTAIGGIIGGWIFNIFDILGVFLFGGIISILLLIVTFSMKNIDC